jgi:hypothetical protein
VTLYHGGSVETDVYGNASLYGMKNVTMMFDERPSFAQIFARLGEICQNCEDDYSTMFGCGCLKVIC